jgi:uncharacterized repeat protein (TIGR02543 family)
MATKMWVKNNANSNWSEVKRMWVKKDAGTIWERVRKVWVKQTTSLWKLVFSGGNLPVSSTTDPISFRYNSYNGTKVTTPYAYIGGSTLSNYYLYGHDGTYTNYTSITNRRIKYAYPTITDILGTLENDDILNTQSNMQVSEECYIWYTLKVNNGSDPFDSVEFEAGPLYMIKQAPYANTYPSISGAQAVNNTISMTYNYSNKWYESPDQSYSYIAWYRSSDGYTLPGVTSATDVGNPQKISYFTDATTNNSTSIQGALTYNVTSADTGYYLVARTVVQNSNTRYFGSPVDQRVATDGAIGTNPPTNTSRPYFQLMSGTANTVGATYRLYPGTWNNPASGTTLQYRYMLDKNDVGGTNIVTYPSTTTFTTDTYFDYTFNTTTSSSISGSVLATNGSVADFPAYSLTSIGPISNVFTVGTVSITGGSSSTLPDTLTKDVSNGATLTASASGFPSGTVFTYQWYRTGGGQSYPVTLGTSASQSVGTSNCGEAIWCEVSWSNSSYPSNGTGSTTTETLTIVPAAPTFTLSDNGNGTFTISNVSTSGGGYYIGTYTTGGNTYNISRNSTSNSSTFSALGSVSVTLYGVVYVSALTSYFQGWEATTKTITASSAQSAGNQRRVTLPVAFTSSSQTIWISTNGYVGTTVDPSTSISYPTSGLYIGPFQGDLKQTALYYYRDTSNFYIRYQGCYFADANQTVDYLMKFTWGSSTVDVYFITNNLTSITPSGTAVQYGGSAYSLWANSTSISGMTIPSGMTRVTTNDNVDDNRTALTAANIFTVTWSANGGTGGGTTTQDAGVAHTAPSTYKNAYTVYFDKNSGTGDPAYPYTTSTYILNGYYDSPVLDYVYGPVAVGGLFYPPYSLNMYARYSTSSNAITTPTQYTLTRSGYTFGGWNTNSSGTGTTYAAGGSYTPTATTTLYAKWTLNTVAPTISSSSISPSSGTAGSTQFTASASASGTPSPTLSYQWQYFSSQYLSYQNIPGATSSTYTPPSNFNTVYPNYGFYCLITASNGTAPDATARPSATLNNPVVVTIPSTPTGLSISSSGLATWNASSGATSYTINYWLASSSSGANAFNAGTVNVGNTTSYQIPYANNPTTGVYCNYADARVLASNSAGSSAYSAWYPSATTYV